MVAGLREDAEFSSMRKGRKRGKEMSLSFAAGIERNKGKDMESPTTSLPKPCSGITSPGWKPQLCTVMLVVIIRNQLASFSSLMARRKQL